MPWHPKWKRTRAACSSRSSKHEVWWRTGPLISQSQGHIGFSPCTRLPGLAPCDTARCQGLCLTRVRQRWWAWPLLLVLLPFVLLGLALWLMVAVVLLLVVWVTWCTRGRYALVVYSNSPVWQEYFETHVLPTIGHRGVVLNWSERNRWRYSLPVALFRLFA